MPADPVESGSPALGKQFGQALREKRSATPRSVTMPVISRAGVTSKAGLAARVPSGASRTRAGVPSASTPLICVTSSAARSSISIAAPPLSVQSMVLAGAAT